MNGRVLNLTFHGIGPTRRALESGEADVWVTEAMFREVLSVVDGRAAVRVTFDDGNASDVTVALPELVRRNMKASFFVVAERVGRDEFLDEGQLRELIAAGMQVGSHGLSHRPWRELGDGELQRELNTAKDRIEQCIGRPVTQAACPFGSYGRRSLAALRRAGFSRVYTSDRGWSVGTDWLQARNTIHPGAPVDEARQLIEGKGDGGGLMREIKLTLKRWR